MGTNFIICDGTCRSDFTGFLLSLTWERSISWNCCRSYFESLVWQKQSDAKKLRKESSMVQPDGEPQRISSLICRKILDEYSID